MTMKLLKIICRQATWKENPKTVTCNGLRKKNCGINWGTVWKETGLGILNDFKASFAGAYSW